MSVDRSILGVDLGYPQGVVNFQAASWDGVLFAFIRASQGCWKDPRFPVNWTNAKRTQVIRAPYIVYEPTEDGPVHITTFFQVVGFDYGELNVMFDLEKVPVYWNVIRYIVDGIEERTQREIIPYSRPSFLDAVDVPAWFQKKDHMIASYNDVAPKLPQTYTPRVICWQQSNGWNVPWVNM